MSTYTRTVPSSSSLAEVCPMRSCWGGWDRCSRRRSRASSTAIRRASASEAPRPSAHAKIRPSSRRTSSCHHAGMPSARGSSGAASVGTGVGFCSAVGSVSSISTSRFCTAGGWLGVERPACEPGALAPWPWLPDAGEALFREPLGRVEDRLEDSEEPHAPSAMRARAVQTTTVMRR